MENKRHLFEKMPVPKALATLAIPTIISQLITMIYNLADTFFIAMANNDSQTFASSLSFTLVFLMASLSNLFGVGGGSLISRLLGEKRDKDAASVASFCFYGSLGLALIYSLVVGTFGIFIESAPLLKLIGATETALPYVKDYAFWVIVIGAVPTTLSMTMSHLLRSEGHAKQASIGLGLGGVLNIALDPLFMFVILTPGNETKGAAIATMLSNFIVLIYYIIVWFMMRKKSVLSISPKHVVLKKHYVKNIFAVGFPAALGTFLACASNIVINNLAAGYHADYGDVAGAAIGIAKKVDMLPMNVGMGLCQGMMPLVAYNFASGDHKRMRAFSRCARNAGMIFAGMCILLFQLFAPQIVKIFNGEEMAENCLRILCLAVPLMIFNVQISFSFQAMGYGKQSLILSSLRQGVVNIPLLFIMNSLFGFYGIVWTQLISDFITAVISYTVYYFSVKKLLNEPKEA